MNKEFSERAGACVEELGAVLRKYGVRLVSEAPCVLELRYFNAAFDGEFLNLILRDCIEDDRQARNLPRVITRVMDDGVQTKDGAA